MGNDVYVCYSYYHLLISIIKIIKGNTKATIIISSNDSGSDPVFNDKKISKKVNKINNVDKVLYFDANEKLSKPFAELSYFEKFIAINKFSKKYKNYFDEYNNIYMFNDTSLLGRVINKNDIRYHLIEDGTNCFKNNPNIIHKKNSLFKIIKCNIFGLRDMGDSKNIIDIEVNDSTGLSISNLKEVPKKKIFESLSNKERDLICSIFLPNDNFYKYNDYSLIVTQPLSEDGILKDEKQKIDIYRKIINDYCDNKKTVIKTHPRDLTDYSSIVNSKNIIVDNFPIELLNLLPNVKFNKIITVSSTSIDLIDNCSKRIYLGWDWLEKNKEG